MDISRVLSPEPLLWADDEAEREPIDAQRRRYYLFLNLDFSLLPCFSIAREL